MAYNQEFKEKQSFEEAIKNADDFFTKGLLKMHKNTDVISEVITRSATERLMQKWGLR